MRLATPCLWPALLALLCWPAIASAASPEAQERERLTRLLVDRWAGHVDRTYAIGAERWAAEMAPAFGETPLADLRLAAAAADFEGMNDALLGTPRPLGPAPTPASKRIGDAMTDLVYTPLAPCRILDTRLAGGALAAGGIRQVQVRGVDDFAGQGGASGDCGLGAVPSLAALAVNVTAVSPANQGFLTLHATGTPRPLAASLVYAPGGLVSNEVIATLDAPDGEKSLDLFSNAASHVVMDVTGYFAPPEATGLSCLRTESGAVNVANGALGNATSAACPAGYAITGGSCTANAVMVRLITFDTSTSTRTQFCVYFNESGGNLQVNARAICCRVPGR